MLFSHRPGTGEQRRIPVLAIFDVLYVAGSAIRFVLGNQHAVTSLFYSAVVTLAASGSWCGSINRKERIMTTRA